MTFIQSISTDGLPAHRRTAFWNEAVCETFTQLEARPHDPLRFSASLQRIDLGEVTLARAVSRPSVLRHTEARIRRAEESVFLLHLQANGDSINVQDGREAVLRTGDFTICDSARPYALRFDSLNDMLVLRIPTPWLESRVARPMNLTAVRVRGDRAVGLVVSQMVRSWWAACLSGLDPDVSCHVATNVLDLLATALTMAQPDRVNTTTASNAKRLRIQHYIDNHLADLSLGAQSIAPAVGVTPRYVHRLLEESGETLGERILRLRLERCAQRLRDPGSSGQSITQIAFDLAFVDASYFGRCFKRRFGMTPGEYRRRSDY